MPHTQELTADEEAAQCRAIVDQLIAKYRKRDQGQNKAGDTEGGKDARNIDAMSNPTFNVEKDDVDTHRGTGSTIEEGFEIYKLRVPVSFPFSQIQLPYCLV